MITGSETITYANHSPDTLAFVWIQLDQNLFARGSEGAQAFPTEAEDGFEGGFEIRSVQSGGRDLPHTIRDTQMRVELAQPLAPGGTVAIAMQGSTTLQTFGWFVIGTTRSPFPLAPFGAGTCVINNDPLFVPSPFGTNVGRAHMLSNQRATRGSRPCSQRPVSDSAASLFTYGAIAMSAMEKRAPASHSESPSACSILCRYES